MKCAWQAYLNILPIWMREDVNKAGAERLQELRIRIGYPPQLIFKDTVYNLYREASPQDITYIINIASEFSPWTAQTIRDGYITASGGHRIGICGLATFSDGIMKSISQPTSICIRVARDVEGIARPLSNIDESILLIGPPGSGKTTLLRDFIRCKSNMGIGSICVVDEREEIFPMHKGQACFSPGRNTDILSAADKICGINAVLRCMNPAWKFTLQVPAPLRRSRRIKNK